MPGPDTFGSLLSSTTSRTTMSQRSSDSHRIAITEDERLLTVQPGERRSFVHTDPWRVLRIMGEFVEGFDRLSDIRTAVSIFGPPDPQRGDAYSKKARGRARPPARQGSPITGGGAPGIRGAANR